MARKNWEEKGLCLLGGRGEGGCTYGAGTYSLGQIGRVELGRVERKASPDKAFGLGLFLMVARWRASLGRGRILARVHCHLRLGCLVAGPAAWAVRVLAGESFRRVIGERCPNLATDTLSRSG